MNRPLITPASRLSELQELAKAPVSLADSTARVVRGVEQSMRVEGYPVSEGEVRSSAARILRLTTR